MTQLDPKALEAATAEYARHGGRENISYTTSNRVRAAITAYLSALPPPAEAGELVERLRQTARDRYSAPEHYDEGITKDISDAADIIQSLSLRLETVTRERDALNARRLRYAHVRGTTLSEIHQAFTETELYGIGDALLVWVNEGDFIMSGRVDASLKDSPNV